MRRLRQHRWVWRLGCTALAAVLAVGVLLGGYAWWFTHRGQPQPMTEQWAEGVRYEREARISPRTMTVHVVTIDLARPELEIVVTPAEAEGPRPVHARLTTQFLADRGLLLAVNANFFYPFHATSPLDYGPRAGEAVEVLGRAASAGRAYGDGDARFPVMNITRDGRVEFDPPRDRLWNAVAGLVYVVRDGCVATLPTATDGNPAVYPRLVGGTDRAARRLILVLIDGKQPSYSDGATIREAGEVALQHGMHTGILLDGGGSATLAKRTAAGSAEMVNATSNFRMPWWERPVANHLGVRVR